MNKYKLCKHYIYSYIMKEYVTSVPCYDLELFCQAHTLFDITTPVKCLPTSD